MNERTNRDSFFVRLIYGLRKGIAGLTAKRKKLNRNMKEHYSASKMAFAAAMICGLLSFLILFVPPFLGVANDGTVSLTMRRAGLDTLSEDTADNYNNYFIRTYEKVSLEEEGINSHIVLIRAAKLLDDLFTHDAIFDIRFLAFLYWILYIPAVYILMRAALLRLMYFSENVVSLVLGVLIFADVSYVVYFNSLYPEALYFIGILYITGSTMSLQKERKENSLYLILSAFWGTVLSLTNQYCFGIGLALAVFYIMMARIMEDFRYRFVLGVLSAICLSVTLTDLFFLGNDFTDTARIHAMTRGVLLQSSDPAKTLKEFDLDPSYEVLADISLYDDYPISEETNPWLHEDFLDQYNTGDIVLYYLKHPGSMVSMLDLGIKSSFYTRRDYCGNYEKSAGHPARSQSIFWSWYSTYKMRSAPQTIGYFAALIAAYLMLSVRKAFRKNRKPERAFYVYLITMSGLAVTGILSVSYAIYFSGDSEFAHYSFIMGLCMDLMLFFVLAEIMYKLNILETDGKGAA